jgi:GTP-binding protein
MVMEIITSEFVTSSVDVAQCPPADKPEFAFIGRSNVGKSSLINMLAQHKALAKTSSTPGKTQTINHFLMNRQWYVVDLPGYGYAKVSKKTKAGWPQLIESYLLSRESLYCTFVLVDARLDPQPSDLAFIHWLGTHQLPLAVVLTKADKLTQSELARSKKKIESRLLKTWEQLPPIFITSSEKKTGRAELLRFIEDALNR